MGATSYYSLSNLIRVPEFAPVYSHLNALMNKNDRFLAREYLNSYGFKKGPVLDIFKVICVKTLAFQKPYEMLDAHTFINGDEFVAGIGSVTTRTVTNHMKRLRESGLICEFHRQGSYWFYALNLEPLFDFLTNRFSTPVSEDASPGEKARRVLWDELAKLKDKFSGMIAYVKSLADRVFRDFERFAAEAKACVVQSIAVVKATTEEVSEVVVDKVEQAKEFAMSLADSIKSVTKAGAERVAEKQKQRAGQPLFDLKGRPNGRAGLAVWHSLVRDVEILNYVPESTIKMVGQMNNWLKALRTQGMDEEAIRDKMENMIRAWPHMSRNAVISAVSAKGKPYKVNADPKPNFDKFYPHRKDYERLLLDANVPLVALSNKEKAKVDFTKNALRF